MIMIVSSLFGLIDEETGAIVRSKGAQTMPLNEPAVRYRGGPAKAAPLEELPLLQENVRKLFCSLSSLL